MGKYSTTYKNKTTSGKRLSISNGIVYLDGKQAYPGYKWFDKGNGATYRVNKDGSYSHIAINGKPITRSTSTRKGYYIDMPTRYIKNHMQDELDPDFEYSNVVKFNKQAAKRTLKRAGIEENYFIPGYLPNVRRNKILSTSKNANADLFKDIDYPVNEVDSIVKNVILTNNIRRKQGKAPIRFEDAFGLLHETSNNKHMPITVTTKGNDWGPEYNYNALNNNPFYRRSANTKGVIGYYPTDVANNHHYYTSGANDVIGELARKGHIKTNLHQLNVSLPIFDYSVVNREKVNEELSKPVIDNSSNNPWINAFNYYMDNNYGMGKNYIPKNRELGTQLLSDPTFKKEVNRAKNKYRSLEDN